MQDVAETGHGGKFPHMEDKTLHSYGQPHEYIEWLLLNFAVIERNP